MELDAFFNFRRGMPNAEGCAGAEDALHVAKRALFMAMTHAAHTLVITLRDPQSDLAAWLREAAFATPSGIVEYIQQSVRANV